MATVPRKKRQGYILANKRSFIQVAFMRAIYTRNAPIKKTYGQMQYRGTPEECQLAFVKAIVASSDDVFCRMRDKDPYFRKKVERYFELNKKADELQKGEYDDVFL